jgi:hypothetical protein
MPYSVSFGLIHDKRDSVLPKGSRKLYLYNTRIIGKMFEEYSSQIKEPI